MFKFIANIVSKDGDFSPLRLSMITFFIFGGLTFFLGRNLNPDDFSYEFLLDLHETSKFLFDMSIFAIIASGAYEIYKNKQ